MTNGWNWMLDGVSVVMDGHSYLVLYHANTRQIQLVLFIITHLYLWTTKHHHDRHKFRAMATYTCGYKSTGIEVDGEVIRQRLHSLVV